MIDITGLREDKRPQSSTVVHALLDRLEAAEKERDELLEALKSIEEYWNQDQNETAMMDACWHAINTARAAITRATGEEK